MTPLEATSLAPLDDVPAAAAPAAGASSRRHHADASELMDLIAMSPERRNELHLGRRERRRLETFERLVGVARDILFSQNLKRVAVEDITTGADTGKGTFFNYFPTKEQVVPSQMALIQRSLLETLQRVEREGVPATQALVDRYVDYFCPAQGDWLTYEQNLMQSLLEPESRQTFSSRILMTREAYIRLMQLGQQQGTIRRDVAHQDLAMFAHTMIIGMTVMFWIHGITPTRESVTEAVGQVVRLIQAPLEPAPVPPVERRARAASTGTRRKKRPVAAATKAARVAKGRRQNTSARAKTKNPRPAARARSRRKH